LQLPCADDQARVQTDPGHRDTGACAYTDPGCNASIEPDPQPSMVNAHADTNEYASTYYFLTMETLGENK